METNDTDNSNNKIVDCQSNEIDKINEKEQITVNVSDEMHDFTGETENFQSNETLNI